MAETGEATIPWELAEEIRSRLQPGEPLLWCAQPRADLLVRKSLGNALPWYLTAFVVSQFPCWGMAASAPGTEKAFPLVGALIVALPFVAALVVRLLMARVRASRTIYLITDRRAGLISTAPSWKMVSLPPALLAPEVVRRRADGVGEILLTPDRRTLRAYGPTWLRFVGVENVEHVKRLLDDLAAGAPAGP